MTIGTHTLLAPMRERKNAKGNICAVEAEIFKIFTKTSAKIFAKIFTSTAQKLRKNAG